MEICGAVKDIEIGLQKENFGATLASKDGKLTHFGWTYNWDALPLFTASMTSGGKLFVCADILKTNINLDNNQWRPGIDAAYGDKDATYHLIDPNDELSGKALK